MRPFRHAATPPATSLCAQGRSARCQWHRHRSNALLVLLLLLLCSAPATAQLMVHPTRIVLEPNQRSAQLEIINNSDEPGIYRIALVNRRMDENGEFAVAESPLAGEQFADSMLRYSPRHVTLGPGASQLIRVMARRPANLAAGEYRSHLLFDKQPTPAPRGAPATPAAGGEIGVSLTALVGVSVPVIVRHGATTATASLANLALGRATSDQPAVLSVDMHRVGTRSLHGDLVASFTPAGGTAQVIGRAGGVAVYTPNTLRRLKIKLSPPPGMVLAKGTLSVTYREPAARGGGLLAEASLALR